MILQLVLIVQFIYITYQSCHQITYTACMNNTPNDSCVFLDNKCYQSNDQNFGCASSLNQNLCLIQNAKCQYIQKKCLSIEQTTLDRIRCEGRQITREACTHITSDRCIYSEQKCKQYLLPPSIEERCETQYNVNGMFMIVSPLLCSQIQDKACIWNPSNYLCTSEIQKEARCDDLGLSRLACIQITTNGQKCIHLKQNKFCKDQDCPYVCQNNFLDQCHENMNQNACLSVQSEACQFLNGKCQKINPTSCINNKVNEKTCTIVETELCMYNPKKLSCEIPSLLFLDCDAQGLNKQACVQLQELCIFDEKCRTLDYSELFNIQCEDAVSKKTCLSIQTQLQNCYWNSEKNECQELSITRQTSCASLKQVNGNSCKSVTYESCKYLKENCINSELNDSCDAPFINLIGCTSILKFQTPCQWINNQCTRATITSDRSCDSYTFVNPVVCSLYYKMIEDPNFICYVDDNFTQFDYTCRYDSAIMSCRSLRKEEFTTLPCGDKALGLNLYACSLLQTKGQVCIFRAANCIQMSANEQYQIQCNIIQGNPSSCSYTTYGKSPCKFNLKTCGCLNSIDIKRDKCDTIGMNSIGCGLITLQPCYFNNVNTAQFQCLPKIDDSMISKLDCQGNSPNQKLCLAINTPGQLCTWSSIKQICENVQIDNSQSCGYYVNVNVNVCTQIESKDSSSNYKAYCYYDPSTTSCKSWTQGRYCIQSCCMEQIGINIHVCSAMTNFDDSYCYFDKFKCRKYEVSNEVDFKKIFVIFNQNYKCEQFNFKLCGLINPSFDEQFYCYQSSANDKCQTLLPNIYNQMNKAVFLTSTVRSNVWTCIKINQDNIKVRYDPIKGKCESITETITCEQYQVNKQACLELTRDSSCYWDEINFQCKETSRLEYSQIYSSLINQNACLNITNTIIKRFNKLLFVCQDLQEINASTQCTSLGQNYSYNEHACKQVNNGESCSYDHDNKSCKLQTEKIPNCHLFGQNKQSCLSNTLGLCKWSESEFKCMETIIDPLQTQCDANLNKFACMKISSQNCYFDTQCKPLTQIFTCDQLVHQSKLLSRYFNQRSCVSLKNNQRCAYDIKNFQCINFTTDQSKIKYNYTCTQFPMNIHLCLSHTQGSYCIYDEIKSQCSNYTYVQSTDCSTTNLNRDVCINSTESCRFNLNSSTCESFTYGNQFCSELKAEGGYLYGVKTCAKVSNQKKQQDFNLIPGIICFSYQCNIEYYCTYNAQQQGCEILPYLEEDRKKNSDGQNICEIKKRFLECDRKFNEFVCLHLTDIPCYFNRISSECLKLDQINNKIATCDSVSAAGCTYVETVGQQCYVQTKQFEPIACNSGLPTYQICSSRFDELPPIPVPGTYGENLQFYYYYQSEYYFVSQISVNANKCSILCDICIQGTINNCYQCGVIFDDENRMCIKFDYNFGCNSPGMSRYLCDLYKQYCEFKNQKCQNINSNTNNQEAGKCNNTILYQDEFGNFQNKAKECITNNDCAFIKQQSFQSKVPNFNNETACDKCKNDASQQQALELNECTNNRNQNCGSFFTSASQCYYNQGCRDDHVTIQVNTGFGTQDQTVYCDNNYYYKFQLNCQCLYNQCNNQANNKFNQATSICTNSDSCRQYIYACEQYNKTIKDFNTIQNTYQYISKQYCLEINTTTVIYKPSDQTYSCEQIYSNQYKCANLNQDSCVKLTNVNLNDQSLLYCGWKDKQCNKIKLDQFYLYKVCEQVNINACLYINAQCMIENNSCIQRSGERCTNSEITNQLKCQQLQQDQCVLENGLCININTRKQSYPCSKPGLNKNACLINTNQICQFDNDEQKCTQITDFSNFKDCKGLNVKGCTENLNRACIWDWNTISCNDVETPTLSSCENFQSQMPIDYLINYQTCLIIESACIYKDNKCYTPTNEDGCSNQLYNKLGCTQKTNQFCQAIVDKNNDKTNVICVEIGDFNQQCNDTLNYYACIKMLGCIWQDGICNVVTDTFQTQYSANPYICQNLEQKGTQFYNKINGKCEIATQKIYQCTDPYINKDTCLQLTNTYCYYLLNNGVVNYKDTTQRCLNYDKSLLFTQTCQDDVNYIVCSNVVNSACVFKEGECQSSQNLTCLQLSQQGIYASKQACAQTKDGFCAYDEINQRCRIIDLQTKLCGDQKPCLCDMPGVNEQLCLSINAFQNKCEFKTQSVLDIEISYCEYATQSNYKCTDNISMDQCILIGNCKYYNYQCSQLEIKDFETCVKSYQVSGQACTGALDVPCGYDQNINKCIENPISNIQYFNKLACIQSSIQQNLIFLNGQCQIAQQALKCSDDINLFACTHIDPQSGQECIFDQKCQFIQIQECEKSLNVNNPISCSKTVNSPCKFKDYNCVIAIDNVTECQYQGLNNLACIMPNLISCQNCAELLLNSYCSDVKSKSLCLSLNRQCQWKANLCIGINIQDQTCEQLPVGVNIYTCYSVNMDSIDQVCVYDKNQDKCLQQEVSQCQNLNSQKTCIFNTKLSCIWQNNKCVQQTPLRNQDYCTSYLSSNQFCIQIERFDASCELIQGVCQEAQYKQQNWEKFINRKGCLQQKLKYCYWQNRCICYDGEMLLQKQSKLNCSQDLSFLMCLSIQTSGQYCQFQYGQCNQLILPQQLKWNQYQLINQNVCTQVDQYLVGYDKIKYSCKILKQIDDCNFPGLNIISCLSDILDYPCMWLNEKCQHIQGQSRLLQQVYGKINAAYCYEMKDPVYYDGQQCQRVNELTKCEAQGLSKAGCLSIKSEPCRWISDDEGCIKDYPFDECESNFGMVNAVFCKYVEIGQCRYDSSSNSCKIATFDTWVYSFQDQKCICITQNCDFNKISQECMIPSYEGINSNVCTSIQGAIFNNYECFFVNTNSNCPKLYSANPLACKYVTDICVYDPIEENCTSISYNGVCEDISISQLGCQQNNCHYFNNQCTCKQLAYVKCLTYSPLECQNNNLCYWEDGQCNISQCQGLNDNCQSQINCYRRLKNGKQVCEYANTCEEVQLDSNIQSTCTEVFIDNKPCYPNSLLNSSSTCVTLKCEQFNNPVYCTSTIIGKVKISDYCIYIKNQCMAIGCNDIQNEESCNQQNGCYYIQNKENQKICQEFKSCDAIKTDYVNLTAQFICNKMEVQDLKQYTPCAWMKDGCVTNPCQYLGIDQKICNGAHINNKYVCALDQVSLTCNVCEMYEKGCDCLNNDKYCTWNTNKQICQSIPCIKIVDKNTCLNRQDCQYEQTCLAKCSYHLNQQYCKENQCYWDSYNSYCAECDIKFCEDSQCQNTKCCQMKQIKYKDKIYSVCYPKCEKIVQSQCNYQCNWRVDLELCEYYDELNQTNGDQ